MCVLHSRFLRWHRLHFHAKGSIISMKWFSRYFSETAWRAIRQYSLPWRQLCVQSKFEWLRLDSFYYIVFQTGNGGRHMSLNRRRLHFQGGKSGSRVMHPDFVTIYDVFSSRRIYYWKKKQTKNSFDRFVSVSLVNVTHANVPSFPAPAISLHAAGKFEMKKHGMDCGDIQPINIITPCTCTNSAAYSSIR